jgi:hypothetical protein
LPAPPGRATLSPVSSRSREWVGDSFDVHTVTGTGRVCVLVDTADREPRLVAFGVRVPGVKRVQLGDQLRTVLRDRPGAPMRIRLGDPALADEIRDVVGTAVDIAVAPAPEVESLRAFVTSIVREAAAMGADPDESARRRASHGELFDAAASLWRAAPWQMFDELETLRVDIPDLGIDNGCLIAVAPGGSPQLVLFPSFAVYATFLERVIDAGDDDDPDLAVQMTMLNYQNGRPELRRTAADAGWPLGAPGKYPVVTVVEADGSSPLATRRDLQVMTACAWGLSRFVERHQRRLREGLRIADAMFELGRPVVRLELMANDRDAPSLRE